MAQSWQEWLRFFFKQKKKQKGLSEFVLVMTGRPAKNIKIFDQAFRHSSLSKAKSDSIQQSNERLEYLGDAILGAIVAEFLFKKYPYRDEGFLTEIRSRIVNGESLGNLAKKIGLFNYLEFSSKNKHGMPMRSMGADALEAFIGAVYLDRGFKFCKKFVLSRLIEPHFDLDELVEKEVNFKSKLIAWSQLKLKTVRFEILEEKSHKNHKEFTAQVLINGEAISQGKGTSKKKAEQQAAKKACELLINQQI